jgi:hypothetical protein
MSEYPSDADLRFFDTAPLEPTLLNLIRDAWWDGADSINFHTAEGKTFLTLHTVGWSGNESIISSLRSNKPFWACLKDEKPGGHYYFEFEFEKSKDRKITDNEARGMGYFVMDEKPHIHLTDYAKQEAKRNPDCDECCDKMVMSVGELEQKIEEAKENWRSEAARYIRANVVPNELRGAIKEMLSAISPNIMTLCAEEAGWVIASKQETPFDEKGWQEFSKANQFLKRIREEEYIRGFKAAEKKAKGEI